MSLKPRDAMTYEWAATRAVDILGAAEAAYVIGKSASLIYAWGDDHRETEATPNLRQAETIDKECHRVAGERPFYQVYTARVAGLGRDVFLPLDAFHNWLDGGSGITQEFLKAYDDKDLTPREKERLIKKIRRQKARLDNLEKAIVGEREK